MRKIERLNITQYNIDFTINQNVLNTNFITSKTNL